MQKGLTLLEKLVQQQQGVDEADLDNSWEFGRLVVDPGYRSGPDLVRRCVFLGAHCLFQHTDARNIFASCTPVLARLYRRFGFSVLTNNLAVADAGKSYALIHARVADVLAACASARHA